MIKPKILFVGIAPGHDEDTANRCFHGRSGRLLDEIINELGIPFEELAWDNLVHCIPWMGDLRGSSVRDPTIDEILNCVPHLYKLIQLADPEIIVPLGTLSYQTVTGFKNAFITDQHGMKQEIELCGKVRKVIGTFHPAAALHKGGAGGAKYRDAIKEDIWYAWEYATGKYFLPKWRVINDTDEAVDYIREVARKYQHKEIEFVAYDTETPQILASNAEKRETGLEFVNQDLWRENSRVVGFSLSCVPKDIKSFRDVEGVWIVMDHVETKTDYFAVSSMVRWALDKTGEIRIPVACHNAKYDKSWTFEKFRFRMTNFHDTMMGSYAYFGNSRRHGLGILTHRLLKYDTFKDDTEERLAEMPPEERSFRNLPLDSIGRRGALDAAGTASLVVLENMMLHESGQDQVLMPLLNTAVENFTEMELRGCAIDYEYWQKLVEKYPRMMEDEYAVLTNLPLVRAYIEDRRLKWTMNKKHQLRAPDAKFVFNPSSPDHRYELLYYYYNLPTELAFETGASTEDLPIFSTNENSRHQLTAHCRIEGEQRVKPGPIRQDQYGSYCRCRCHVEGWDTFEADPEGRERRTWIYHDARNYLQYGINPHVECLQFLMSLRFWGKLAKLQRSYVTKIENYFRPEEWHVRNEIASDVRIISFNYLMHWTKCVSRGTLIRTEKGEVPIEELYDLWVHEGCSPKILDGIIYRYPLDVVYVGHRESLTLAARFNDGSEKSITGSPYHMIWTQRSLVSSSGWKRLDKFKTGDQVVLSEGPCRVQYGVVTSLVRGIAEFFDISMDVPSDSDSTVECRVCGSQGTVLKRHLWCTHDLTVEEYLEMFPGSPLQSRTWTEQRASIASSGIKNAWKTESYRDKKLSNPAMQRVYDSTVRNPEFMKKVRPLAWKAVSRSLKQKEAASRTVTSLNLQGAGAFRFRKTYPYVDSFGKSVVFKSSFEYAFALQMDSEGKDWVYESTTLRYTKDNGFVARYTPDFIVEGEYIEVKPEWLREQTQKFLVKYFPTIRIVTEIDLSSAFQLLHDKTQIAAVGADVNKLCMYYGPKIKYGYVANGFICHNTGRMSTRDWSTHTEPWHSDIRRMHCSRYKSIGGVLVSADYSQLELRIAAAIARDQKLIEAYRLGKDIHRVTAAAVYQISEDQVTKPMRRYSKTISFRLIYGGGAHSISQETGLPMDEATKLVRGFLSHYDGIARMIDEFHAHVKKLGWVPTPIGRKFFMPDVFSDDRERVQAALRDSQNWPIQSTASDVTMTAINEIERYVEELEYLSHVWAMIHDAIESDVYPGELYAYYQVMRHCMEVRVGQMYDWLCVPMVADFEIGVRWDGALNIGLGDFKDSNTVVKRYEEAKIPFELPSWYANMTSVIKGRDDGMFTPRRLVLYGRKQFFEELCQVMSRGYNIGYKMHFEMPIEIGEEIILRKSYEGDSGGDVDCLGEIFFKDPLKTVELS